MTYPLDTKIRSCIDCGNEYAERTGRGKQSPRCDDCRRKHNRVTGSLRSLRHTMATMREWIEVFGPRIIREKEDLSERQDHRCLRCDRHRKLYAALNADGQMIGLCGACYAVRDQLEGAHRG